MGNFDDLVPGNNKSNGGNFDEFISTTPIPKAENILQRAVQSTQQSFQPQGGYSNPMIQAMSQSNPAMAGYNVLHNFKSGMIQDAMPNNPVGKVATDVATDPESYIGLGGATKAVGEIGSNILNPSKAYGKALSSAKGTVDFLPHIMQAIDDPVAGKLIEKSGIMEKFGGSILGEGGAPIEKLSNLSAEDSQGVVNSLKDEVTKAVREGTLKPKQLEVGKLFGNLSDAQNEAFDGMKNAKWNYGAGKSIQKGAKRAIGAAILGGGFESGKDMVAPFVKHLFGLKE